VNSAFGVSWCVSKSWLNINPASQNRHGERLFFDDAPIRRDTFTREEFHRIRTAARGDLRHVVTLLGNWGLRISELAMLEWTDIDEPGGWVRIRNKITHDGILYRPKDKTDRKLPLLDASVLAVLNELAQRAGRTGYVLPYSNVKSRSDAIERRFLASLKGLAEATSIPQRRLTLHRFRSFFVSECADAGVPMATVMDWVGHDEMKMVMHYYALRDGASREAMRRVSGALNTAPPGPNPETPSRQPNGPVPEQPHGPRRHARRPRRRSQSASARAGSPAPRSATYRGDRHAK
jgi:integrase